MTAPASCQWSATSNAGWLAVTAGSPGTSSGVVSFSVERNRDVNPRSGTIAVGERTFTVNQAGDPTAPVACQYSVTPIAFSPCMSVGYTLTATVTTEQGCTWTATPDSSWITMTGEQSGNDPASSPSRFPTIGTRLGTVSSWCDGRR